MEANKRPLILVSNDDGLMAKGINELIKFLRPLGELVVMAPEAPRSGSGCALTVNTPVHYQLVRKEVGLTVYRCSGTPTDCIKLARHTVLDGRVPDLVVSGINHGDNSATNVHYSGTMGVVIEGCLNGIPSIGFSLCDHASDADFSAAELYVRAIVGMVLEKGLPPLTCLNVNFPATTDIKGVRVCQQAKGHWEKEWAPCPRLDDTNYYWLTGEFIDHESDNENDDHWALNNGCVAITPVTVDMTAYAFIDTLDAYCREAGL
ncbi:MAG: 5'/3'-nucleotidase SurE [Mediterranea sp.]|jgi:5'-nucleotidase|nr:5'/3'-nucleotidase SurE [Mediterranea sp.]